jgi:hypothetical protein
MPPFALKRIFFEDFKRSVKRNAPLPQVSDGELLIRAMPGDPQTSEPSLQESRQVLWKISDSTVDRMGDTISPTGWLLDNFVKGGSVLWAHKSDELPIGKPINTYVKDGALWSLAQYPTKEEYALGDTVYKLIVGGYLRGSSIGMKPKRYELAVERDDGESFFPPINFLEQELLEFSMTPVPANPNALSQAKSVDRIDLNPLNAWLEKALDENLILCGTSRKALEEAYSISKDGQAVSVDLGAALSVESSDSTEDAEAEGLTIEEVDKATLASEFVDLLKSLSSRSEELRALVDSGAIDLAIIKDVHSLMTSFLPLEESSEIEDILNSEAAESELVSEFEENAEKSLHSSNEVEEEDELANALKDLGIDLDSEELTELDSLSLEDLTEDDIREAMKSVLSDELKRNYKNRSR